MIDYSYVELTSACLTAMRKFSTRFPCHRRRQIERAIARGARFIRAVRGWCPCVNAFMEHVVCVFSTSDAPTRIYNSNTPLLCYTPTPLQKPKQIQRPDGSWYGSWGICFTYGTWFGIEVRMLIDWLTAGRLAPVSSGWCIFCEPPPPAHSIHNQSPFQPPPPQNNRACSPPATTRRRPRPSNAPCNSSWTSSARTGAGASLTYPASTRPTPRTARAVS